MATMPFGGFEPLAKMAQGVEKRYQETGNWEGTIGELMGSDNKKYGVKPEVLKELKFTPRDERLAKADILIQGIISTPPEKWNESQAFKAKHLKLNEMTAEQLRYLMDNEVEG